jgi:hypothetical protein
MVRMTASLRWGLWIPAYAGMTSMVRMTASLRSGRWIPAYAGMTINGQE